VDYRRADEITSTSSPDGGQSAGMAGPLLCRLTLWPNPAQGNVHLDMRLAQESYTSLAVFDIQGRLVRTLQKGNLARGKHQFVWDCRDEESRPLSSGTYLVVLSTQSGTVTEKVRLIRR